MKNEPIILVILAAVIVVVISLSCYIFSKNVDKMTGALTMQAFKRKAKRMLSQSKNQSFVLVQLDIKGFKLINRIYNFSFGDKVIKSISAALASVLHDIDSIFAHISIDGFILLLPYKSAENLKRQRQAFINTFYDIMGPDFHTNMIFPTGQYLLTSHDFIKPDIGEMIEKANFAHQLAKQNYDSIIDYEDDIEKEALLEKTIEDRMTSALTDEEFALYLQPKFKLPEEKICGAEALVRWKIDEKYFMYPTDFIPVLERNGFIIQLDKYMFKCTAKKLRSIIDKGLQPVPISVNFSRHHMSNDTFVEELCAIADEYNVPRKYLEIELTESSIYGHVEQISLLIEKLHKEGFLLSMDDFGSGYSCLAQLKELNVDVIKLDKGFFSDTCSESRAKVVVSSILEMAQRLNIKVVAEGVERRDQVDMLEDLKCDIIQGFYFSKPIPHNEFDVSDAIHID